MDAASRLSVWHAKKAARCTHGDSGSKPLAKDLFPILKNLRIAGFLSPSQGAEYSVNKTNHRLVCTHFLKSTGGEEVRNQCGRGPLRPLY